ncbi:MAG: glucose-1-phosphate adenylyltransferase, partial [Clostridia bacterium]|nr:glucose-1-phosphate adenylyltransferase [Clostridia bacterium]
VNGGVRVLPPYQGKNGADWYKGTANAIYQNIDFIDRYSPEHVVVLSGDHIYKMDYNAMLKEHKRTGAACTIAVLEVSLEEASRFGIMNTDENNKIYEFEEKPKNPKSTKASMGIYVFDYKKLRAYLIADEADETSSNDFGKNIIPAMLKAGEPMYAYSFNGYWKDVGTIQSLWEANMDLLGRIPKFDLYDRSWRIFFRNNPLPPHFAAQGSSISNSLITEGCEIYGAVKDSVIFRSVKVAIGATVKDSVILPGAVIGEGATVEYAIIDEGAVIEAGAKIGAPKDEGAGITVIGNGLRISADMDIPVGCMCSAQKLAEITKKEGDA